MLLSIPALVLCFVAVTYGFGTLYALVCNLNRRYMIKAVGWTGFSILGFIGVPFHEISHLIMALLFNHSITDVALYRPVQGKSDGCLGYVHHGYNRASLFQTVGNFFIGVAPMLFGAGLLTLLLHFAVPDSFVMNVNTVESWSDVLNIFKQTLSQLINAVLSVNNINIAFVLLIISAFIICPHLGMSGADFKGVLSGTIFLLVASLTVPPVIVANFNITYDTLCMGFLVFFIYYTYALFMGLFVSSAVMLFNKILSLKIKVKGV